MLIVEDDALIARVERTALQRAGHDATTAATLAEARTYLGQTTPELILLDLHLEDGSALELVRTLRTGGFAGRIVIASGDDAGAAVLAAGADAFLLKPFSPGELTQAVAAALL